MHIALHAFILIASFNAVASAQARDCAQARREAALRYDHGVSAAADRAERGEAARAVSAALAEVRESLSTEDAKAIRRYAAQAADRSDTDEVRAILDRLVAARRGRNAVHCLNATDSIVAEGMFANVPSSQSGFHLCRKIEGENTSVVGHAWDELTRFFKKPVFCDNPLELNCSLTGMDLYPETTHWYSFSFPRQERSLQILEPSTNPARNADADTNENRFRIRACYGHSRDGGSHATRMCEVLNLRELLERGVTAADVLADNSNLAPAHPSRCRFISLQTRELCDRDGESRACH